MLLELFQIKLQELTVWLNPVFIICLGLDKAGHLQVAVFYNGDQGRPDNITSDSGHRLTVQFHHFRIIFIRKSREIDHRQILCIYDRINAVL